jgi:hypothetical protein
MTGKTLLVVDRGTCSSMGRCLSTSAQITAIKTVQHSYNVSGNNSCRVLAMSATFDESGPLCAR